MASKKEGSFRPLIFIYLVSFLILFLWPAKIGGVAILQKAVHFVLDPTLGWLLNWNLTLGMLIVVFAIAFLSIVAQKYATNQERLKELKHEQKKLQSEMKEFREHPQKLMELQKKQMEFMRESMKLSTRPIMYTGIPFILLFRWFNDLFTANSGYTLIANPTFLGFMSWFWFYLVFTLAFSLILRKVMKVV